MTDHLRPTAKDALLDAAAELLSRNPGVSLAEIAEKAGVGRATLHRHFATREALIKALALESLRRMDAVTAPLSPESLDAGTFFYKLLEALLPLGDRYHFLGGEPGAFADPEIKAITDRQLAEMGELIEWLKAEGEIAPEIPTAWAAAVIDAQIYAAWTAVRDGLIARRDAPDLLFRTLLNGLGPSGDPHA